MAPPTPTTTDLPTPDQLIDASQALARISRVLLHELAIDEVEGFRHGGEALSPDDYYALARQAAHHARIVLQVAERICRRCDAPLFTLTDRQTGICAACRDERAAVRARRGAMAGGPS